MISKFFRKKNTVYPAKDQGPEEVVVVPHFKMPDTRPSLAFKDVSYTVFEGIRRRKKTIISSMSGMMRPGLHALMGPSGCGKSTLLDILADRKCSSRVGGMVARNFRPLDANYVFKAGYVSQFVALTPCLTVKENIYYSAALRMPMSCTVAERQARVDSVIKKLKLNKCANSDVGTEYYKTISGGEKKRACIGVELVTEPEILLVDEPTTGLDSSTALQVMEVIKDLVVSGNKTAIVSIHQPRYEIFEMFDTLSLVLAGRMVYHGPCNKAIDYFGSLGLDFVDEGAQWEEENPADFCVDVLMEPRKFASTDSILPPDPEAINGYQPVCHSKYKQETYRDIFANAFAQSDLNKTLQKELKPLDRAVKAGLWKKATLVMRYKTSPFWQFKIVCWKAVLSMVRNPMTFFLQVFAMVMLASLVGGVFYQRLEDPRGMMDKIGFLFYVVMVTVFSCMNAVDLFTRERASFLHQVSSGYYRISMYFLGQIITDMILLRLLPLTIFAGITYFMVGFEHDPAKFIIYYMTLALSTINGAAAGFTYSAFFRDFSMANLLVCLQFLCLMLFSGALVSINTIPAFCRWLQYVSVFRYATEALLINELKNKTYFEILPVDENGTAITNNCMTGVVFDPTSNKTLCVADAEAILTRQGYDFSMLWTDEIILVLQAIFWLIMAYVALRITKVQHRKCV